MSLTSSTIDALSYIDETPKACGNSELVEKMIQDELKEMEKNHEKEKKSFTTPILNNTFLSEIDRVESSKGKHIDYQAIEPSLNSEDESSSEDLINSLKFYLIQSEYLHDELMNLYLSSKFGQNLLSEKKTKMEQEILEKEKEIEELKSAITLINQKRKTSQTNFKKEKDLYQQEYSETVYQNNLMEQRCKEMEKELFSLKSQASEKNIPINNIDNI